MHVPSVRVELRVNEGRGVRTMEKGFMANLPIQPRPEIARRPRPKVRLYPILQTNRLPLLPVSSSKKPIFNPP